jgi:hypothetical protein
MLQQLEGIYEKYVQDVAKIYKDAKPMDGLFGWGDDPRKDPCHMRFYEETENWVAAFLAANPGGEDRYRAAKTIIESAAAYREKPCFWFMYAAHGLAKDLIGGLTPQQCGQLREFYDESYPKRDRMPVQKDVYKLLKKGAGRK